MSIRNLNRQAFRSFPDVINVAPYQWFTVLLTVDLFDSVKVSCPSCAAVSFLIQSTYWKQQAFEESLFE